MPPRKPIRTRPGTLFVTRAYHIPGIVGTRRCTVWLPPGYHDGDRRYPVAYMFDGQNIFGDETAFAGGWHMHLRLEERAARGKVVPIVIGIHHGVEHRLDDLSPWGLARGRHGRVDSLLDWTVGTLRRFVREDLRVLEGPESTLIGGSSMGGLAALYAGIRHPDVFGRVLAMSPSLWVQRGAMLDVARGARFHENTRIYIDAGGREGAGIGLTAFRMAQILASRGVVPPHGLMWRPDKRGSHNERNWRRRLPKALRFLYDGQTR